MPTNPITSNRLALWYAAGPVGKVLTTSFVAGDVFWVSAENDLLFEATIGGTAPTSLDLLIESSLDGSTNWLTFPIAGVLDGSIATQAYIITGLFPNTYYRLSAKRTGGDGTTTGLIYGSTRDINTDISEYSSITVLGTIIQGNVAHDDPDAGDPIKEGGKAYSAEPTAVDPNDRVNAYYDVYGYKHVKTHGTVVDDVAADTAAPNKMGAVADDVLSAVSDADMVHLVTDLYRRLRILDATYDSLQDANAMVSRNGPETQLNQETIASVENGANGTYDYFIDMTGRRKSGLQLELTGTLVVKIYGTLQADGTVPASCAYQDITEDTFDDVSFTATDMLIDNAEKLACFHYIHVEVVASGGGTDDWTIYHKRLY